MHVASPRPEGAEQESIFLAVITTTAAVKMACIKLPLAQLRPFVAVLGLLYGWFIAPGMFAGTAEYGSEWTGNASVFAVLNWGSGLLMDWIHVTFDTKLFGLVYFSHNLAKVPIALFGVYLLVRGWRRSWPLHQVAATFAARRAPARHLLARPATKRSRQRQS